MDTGGLRLSPRERHESSNAGDIEELVEGLQDELGQNEEMRRAASERRAEDEYAAEKGVLRISDRLEIASAELPLMIQQRARRLAELRTQGQVVADNLIFSERISLDPPPPESGLPEKRKGSVVVKNRLHALAEFDAWGKLGRAIKGLTERDQIAARLEAAAAEAEQAERKRAEEREQRDDRNLTYIQRTRGFKELESLVDSARGKLELVVQQTDDDEYEFSVRVASPGRERKRLMSSRQIAAVEGGGVTKGRAEAAREQAEAEAAAAREEELRREGEARAEQAAARRDEEARRTVQDERERQRDAIDSAAKLSDVLRDANGRRRPGSRTGTDG